MWTLLAGSLWGCAQSMPLDLVLDSPELTDGQHTSTVTVTVGRTLTLRLPSNPSTGYRWVAVEPTPPGLHLKEPAHYVPGTTNLIGAPGTEIWRYSVGQSGEGCLQFDYRRPFEPAEVAPAQTVRYKVLVP